MQNCSSVGLYSVCSLDCVQLILADNYCFVIDVVELLAAIYQSLDS